jgi:hypothetical protein
LPPCFRLARPGHKACLAPRTAGGEGGNGPSCGVKLGVNFWIYTTGPIYTHQRGITMKDRTYCLTCEGVTDCLPIFLADPCMQQPTSWVRCGSLCLQCRRTSRPLDGEKLPDLLQRVEYVAAILMEQNQNTTIATKRCARCGQDKPLTAFYIRPPGRRAERHYGYCKACHRDYYYAGTNG